MNRSTTFLAGLTLALTFSTATAVTFRSPTIDAIFSINSLVTISGVNYQVWDMFVDVHSGDWTNSQLTINLITGSFYNHAFGGNATPNAALIGAVPDLQYDTFVGIPQNNLNGAPATWNNTFNPAFASVPVSTATSLDIGWGDAVNLGPGTWKIAQITVSLNAEGTISGSSFTSIDDYRTFGTPAAPLRFPNFYLVPEGIIDVYFTELSPGYWEVEYEVSGYEATGLASFEIQLSGLAPGQNSLITWDQLIPTTTLSQGPVGSDGFVISGTFQPSDGVTFGVLGYLSTPPGLLPPNFDAEGTLYGDFDLIIPGGGVVSVFVEPIPEPASLSLLALGALTLLTTRRQSISLSATPRS